MKKFVFILLITHCSLLIAQTPTEEWVRRFSSGPNIYASGLSIKLDAAGYIYVLVNMGTDSTYRDYGVLKYDPSGNLLWNAYYNTPENLADSPIAFDVTGAGDVYVTGESGINFVYQVLTVKFNSNGIFQWARTLPPISYGRDLKIDKDGNAIVVSGGSRIIKYDSQGDTLWTRNVNIGARDDYIFRITTDDSSNIYAAGYTRPDSLRSHFLTLKYNTSGNLIWYSTYYNDPGYQVDFATCITLDVNRNIYVAGQSHTLTPGYDNNSLLKISPIGIILWARVYKGIGENNAVERPKGIAVTPEGSGICYTTFCGNGTGGGGYEIVTLKYNSSGDSIWVRRYGGGVPATANEPANIILDKMQNAYVTGLAYNSNTRDDYVTIKYLPNGTQQWVTTYNGYSNFGDYAHDIIIDTSLNVYVTGISSKITNFSSDAVTIKYNQVIGISPNSNQLPERFMLEQNYPNPFNSVTVFSYALPKKSNVKLFIYNIAGQLVKTLVNSQQNSGYYSIVYNAEDLSSGVYFYTLLSSNSTINSKKFILLK